MTSLKPGQLWAFGSPRGDIEELRLILSIDRTGSKTGHASVTMYCTDVNRPHASLDNIYESPLGLIMQLIDAELLVLLEDVP